MAPVEKEGLDIVCEAGRRNKFGIAAAEDKGRIVSRGHCHPR